MYSHNNLISGSHLLLGLILGLYHFLFVLKDFSIIHNLLEMLLLRGFFFHDSRLSTKCELLGRLIILFESSLDLIISIDGESK